MVNINDRAIESRIKQLNNSIYQYHGWSSPQAESNTEAECHQAVTTIRPNLSHSYIYIHALAIWWNTEMDSAWPSPAWWDSASVLDLAWGEGHPWIYESNQVGVIVLNLEIIQKPVISLLILIKWCLSLCFYGQGKW